MAVPAAGLPPVSAAPRPAQGKAKLASRAHTDDDSGAGASSVMMLKIAWWAFKAAAKMAIFFVGVFMAAETACRWTEQAFGREVFMPPLRPSRSAGVPYLLPAGDGWSQGGIEYAVNEWALRDSRVDLLKPAGTVRVLLLGGSVAFGADMPVERTVAGQLKALLKSEKGRPGYEVVNGAVWGYSPEEQWAFYANELAQLKPDVVVWLCEDRVGGIPSSVKLKELSQDSWLASSVFKGSHFVRLLMHRQLKDGSSTRATDFLALVQPAEKAARENESKFLYAVLADRELSREEREELPEGSRLDVDETVRRDFFARTSSAQRAVAELIRDRLLSLKPSSAGKSGS